MMGRSNLQALMGNLESCCNDTLNYDVTVAHTSRYHKFMIISL